MKKALLLSFFLLLNGCSFESILALGEVDKVEVVKKNASVSHYRAYFTRTQLKPITKNQKYLYFYNKKKKDLAILLHRYGSYYLYSLYHPEQRTLVIRSKTKRPYAYVKKTLKQKGYTLTTPAHVVATTKVALRRYKGIKTLLVEVKDYSRLLAKYKHAIRNYDASKVKNIKTVLPSSFIVSYYKKYAKQASNKKERTQLSQIADKLHLNKTEMKTKAKTEISDEKEVQEALAKEVPEETNDPVEPVEHVAISFDYYDQEASYFELHTYLSQKNVRDTLSFNQYTQLQQRHKILKEEKVLKDGSLEELIALYKTNKNPKYKKRILQEMKKVQVQPSL